MLSEALTVLPDADAVAAAAAEWLIPHLTGEPGDRAICLTGGDSPLPLYRLLARPEYRSRVDWDHLQVFWTDERMVPHDHPDSNYGAARDALLRHVPVRADHVHPMPVQWPPDHGARDYARRLQAYYGSPTLDADTLVFDAMILGVGDDGHVGSLFPDSPALADTVDWVVASTGYRPQDRISLALPVLASSRATAFVVTGTQKRAIMRRIATGDPTLPAVQLQPAGEYRWFLDEAAWKNH